MKKRNYKNPHQYSLGLRNPNTPEPVIDKNLPHVLFHEGKWMLFRNRWKSQFRFKRPWIAASICGTTIPQLRANLARAYDKASFGFYIPRDPHV